MKKLFIFFVLIAANFMVKAQSHISTGKYACQLVPKSLGYEKYTCPACEKIEQQKRAAKIEEDKRQRAIAEEKERIAKAARIAAAKKLAEENEKKNKVTELHLTMPSSSGSSSSSSNSAREAVSAPVRSSSSSNTSSSAASSTSSSSSTKTTSDVTIYNNMFAAEAARKYNEQKAISDMVTGVVDLFSPSPEKLAREEREREYVRKAAAKDYELGSNLIKNNLANALNGDSLSLVKTYSGYLKTGRRETGLKFATEMHNKHRSKATFDLLKSIYKADESRYNSEISLYQFDRGLNRTYAYMVLGGAAAAVPLLYKNQLIAKHGEDVGTATYVLAGAGGVAILSAIISKIAIPPLSSKAKYKEAVEGLKRLKSTNIQANVVPHYNYFYNSPMLGINVKF